MYCNINYTKYPEIECVMPYMFANDNWILLLNELLKKERNPVKDIYGSVYCAWQSGRPARVFEDDLLIIERYLKRVTSLGFVPNFTFSSLNVNKDKLKDTFSNNLLDLAYVYNSYFIVSSDILYKYIKKRYNNAKMVCSVILPASKFNRFGFNETDFYKKMLDKFEFVVLRPEYTIENICNLSELIPDISRVEVLINQNCYYNCPNHRLHYHFQEKKDYLFYKNKHKSNKQVELLDKQYNNFCPHDNVPPLKFRSVRMNCSQIEQLMKSGVKKFKFQGRDGNFQTIFNDLYEYLFNNEIQKENLEVEIQNLSKKIGINNMKLEYMNLI